MTITYNVKITSKFMHLPNLTYGRLVTFLVTIYLLDVSNTIHENNPYTRFRNPSLSNHSSIRNENTNNEKITRRSKSRSTTLRHGRKRRILGLGAQIRQ